MLSTLRHNLIFAYYLKHNRRGRLLVCHCHNLWKSVSLDGYEACVAQWLEHLSRKQGVVSSILAVGSGLFFENLKRQAFHVT